MVCPGSQQAPCLFLSQIGWPASVLNLFYGVLFFKRGAEVALERSGMEYVVLRPGGMERPTDSYKETHNVRLAQRDTLFGGQVRQPQRLGPTSLYSRACTAKFET